MVDTTICDFCPHARSAFKDWLDPISHREPFWIEVIDACSLGYHASQHEDVSSNLA
jgi:hypothetical protein